jgi:hypothetical protein
VSEAAVVDWSARRPRRARRRGVVLAPANRTPSLAILCSPARGQAAAGALALALARTLGGSCALAGVVGADAAVSFGALPAARRAAALLNDRGLSAVACGRLAWLVDRRSTHAAEDDAAERAAALSAELGRASAAVGAPSAIALPFARTAPLDRVLAWHDAIVVVQEPSVSPAVRDGARTSLALLGRPVVEMTPPARLAAALAVAGVRTPAEAVAAIEQLGHGPGFDDAGERGPDA